MKSTSVVKYCVVDTGGFIRNAPVQDIGEKIYTISDVIEEIRDRATKQRLQVLPYDIVFREPTPEAMKFVSDFAKKTGDYPSLSAVDIRVVALTYQLEKENGGGDRIKSVPDKKVEWTATRHLLEKPTDIAGFYLGGKKSKSQRCSESTDISTDCSRIPSDTDQDKPEPGAEAVDKDVSANTQELQIANAENRTDVADTRTESSRTKDDIKQGDSDQIEKRETDKNETSNSCEDMDDTSHDDIDSKFEGEVIPTDALEEESDENTDDDEEEEEDDDDVDDAGWITPSNIKSVKERMGEGTTETAHVSVGCITTDFAMQNVMIQMGLNVISVDGMLIKKARSFVLRCSACMKMTSRVEKSFCPHCGNKALQRVSVTVQDDGSIRYFLSRRKPFTHRGMKFPLPMPKGGKHANNPYLAEDQPSPQQREAKKAKAKLDVFNPDYIAGQSPFTVNDVTSRAAQLGIKGRRGQTNYWDKRNPNEAKKKSGRRK